MAALSCHVDVRAVIAIAMAVSLALIGASVVQPRSTSAALVPTWASTTQPRPERQLDTWPAVDFAIAVSSAVTTASITCPAGAERGEAVRWRP